MIIKDREKLPGDHFGKNLETIDRTFSVLKSANPNDPTDQTEYLLEASKLLYYLLDRIDSLEKFKSFVDCTHETFGWIYQMDRKGGDLFVHRGSKGYEILAIVHERLISIWRNNPEIRKAYTSLELFKYLVIHSEEYKGKASPSKSSDRFFQEEVMPNLRDASLEELYELFGKVKRETKQNNDGTTKIKRSSLYDSRLFNPDVKNELIIQVIDQRWPNETSKALAFIRNIYPNPSPHRDLVLDAYAKSRHLTREQLETVDSLMRGRSAQEFSLRDRTAYNILTQLFNDMEAPERSHLLLWLADLKELREGDKLHDIMSKFLEKYYKSMGSERNHQNPSFIKELYYSDSITNEERAMVLAQLFVGEKSINFHPDSVKEIRNAVIGLAYDSEIFRTILTAYFDGADPIERVLFVSFLLSDMGTIKGKPELVAKKILEAIPVFGPKIGQILSALEGVVPDNYRKAFTVFFDRAPSMPKLAAIQLLEQYLGKKPLRSIL